MTPETARRRNPLFDRLALASTVGFRRKLPALLLNRERVPLVTSMDSLAVGDAQWRLIRDALPRGTSSILDIGANRGFFTYRLADELPEARITAIEAKLSHCRTAQLVRQIVDYPNVEYLNRKVLPDNVNALPEVDLVVFLAVYHQWHIFMGAPQARELLAALWAKARLGMFFSMADSTAHKGRWHKELQAFGQTSEASRSTITTMLSDLHGADVRWLGSPAYWQEHEAEGKDRRHIFWVGRVGSRNGETA